MKIVIDIPEEFGNHFEGDRFEDSLQRVRFDIHKFLIRNKDMLSGNYEVETLDMLTDAFSKATPLPKGHGKLVDIEDVKDNIRKWRGYLDEDMMARINFTMDNNIPTIIEADKENYNER